MFLKILSVLALIFQAAIKISDYLMKQKELESVREEEKKKNEEIIMERVNEAETIRSFDIDDNFLLKPEERGVRGVQSLSTNILERKGSAFAGAIGSGKTDQSSQQGLGTELFKFTIPKRKVNKVYIHCSDSDHPDHDNVFVIDQWHKQRGWTGIGYHYYIDKNGKLWSARNIEKIPAAQEGNNKGSIAICCGGKSGFTVAQYYKLEDFCREINDAYINQGQKISFYGHCEVSCKTCPNFDYKAVLGLNNEGSMF